jgi:argininosuccinate synthase
VIAPWREWDCAPRATHRLRRKEPDPDRQGQARRGALFGRREPPARFLRGQGAGGPGPGSPGLRFFTHALARGGAGQGDDITVAFERGDPVAIDGKKLSPAALLARLNELGRENGIGRLDLVENRFVGMKSRGMYETPGGTILAVAHRAIESITLDRGAAHLKDELMPKYAELIYNGFWFSPEREMLQALIDRSQEMVAGEVRLKLYKGNVQVIGRESPYSLYDQDLVTFEEGAVAYDHGDAAGFIKLNALRLRTLAQRRKKLAS